jgi:hypothetical protein
LEEKCKYLFNFDDDSPRYICHSYINRAFLNLILVWQLEFSPIKEASWVQQFFERLVCLKDWIDVENRMQYKIEAATSSVETQESGIGTEMDNDSDDENDLWYMNRDI